MHYPNRRTRCQFCSVRHYFVHNTGALNSSVGFLDLNMILCTDLKNGVVYKTVSIRTVPGETSLKLKENVQMWLSRSLGDPIVKIMAKSSHLTKTQLETLLIDVLSESIANKPLKYDEKARLRLTKAQLSRGAFNRTLKQAKENVTKSIFTVLLLGYLGVFDTTTLDPYLEIANKLQSYREAYERIPNTNGDVSERLNVLQTIKEELESNLKNLSKTPSGVV